MSPKAILIPAVAMLALAACGTSTKAEGPHASSVTPKSAVVTTTTRTTPTTEYVAPTTTTTEPDLTWVTDVTNDAGDAADLLSRIADAANATDFDATTSACQDGLDAVGDWQAHADAVPLDGIRIPLTGAYSNYEQAFQSCVDYDFEQATSSITAGGELINQATDAIKAATP